MIKKNLIGAVLMVLFLAGTSFAQDATDQNNPPQGQGAGSEHSHHAPSQAAIDACSGKSEGGSCNYTTPRGKDRSGTCTYTQDKQSLFCKGSKPASS